MRFSSALAASTLALGVSAKNYLGFNTGATFADRSAKFKKDFKAEFETAAKLNGAPGTFNSFRIYTNIQAYSEEDPSEAFDAAVETGTNLLLGIWTSGTDSIQKELNALDKAIEKHGSKLTDLVIGVSIGSEDLYRNSATGVENEAGIGADPKVIVNFIKEFKDNYKGSAIGKVPIGHVDTWDAWTNTTNSIVVDEVDWLGVDEYPYYESGKGNSIDNAGALFKRAFDAVKGSSKGKPIWVTETGWPTQGPDWDEAVPSVKNARKYWVDVGCDQTFGEVPTFWYNIRDSNPDNKMQFAITDNLNTKAYFDLSCPEKDESTSTSADSSATKTKTSGGSPTSTDDGDSDSTSTFVSANPSSTSGSGSDDSSDNSNDEANSTDDSSSPSETADGDSAALSLKTLSVSTYAALALVGGVMAFF